MKRACSPARAGPSPLAGSSARPGVRVRPPEGGLAVNDRIGPWPDACRYPASRRRLDGGRPTMKGPAITAGLCSGRGPACLRQSRPLEQTEVNDNTMFPSSRGGTRAVPLFPRRKASPRLCWQGAGVGGRGNSAFTSGLFRVAKRREDLKGDRRPRAEESRAPTSAPPRDSSSTICCRHEYRCTHLTAALSSSAFTGE